MQTLLECSVGAPGSILRIRLIPGFPPIQHSKFSIQNLSFAIPVTLLAASLRIYYADLMRKWLVLILSLFGLFGAQTNLSATDAPKRVFVIPIREDIESPLTSLVRRGVKEAMEAKAALIVLDMKTN